MVRFCKYFEDNQQGLIEARKAEGGANLGNKIKSAVVDMINMNPLLGIESNSYFHHQFLLSVSTNYAGRNIKEP
jgi:hypothetical protein